MFRSLLLLLDFFCDIIFDTFIAADYAAYSDCYYDEGEPAMAYCNLTSPLSPEILVKNRKYAFDSPKRSMKYVGYFYRLEYITNNSKMRFIVCVFTSKRNGKGCLVCALMPIEIANFDVADRSAKCGSFAKG